MLSANGGRVELTAAAARAVVDSVINTRGVIRANSIGRHNGMIVLNAATGGSKPAGAPAQTIKLAGTMSAAGKHRGTKGGTIVVSGEHIKVTNAKIDASGRRGGGKILIGGDWGGGHPDTERWSTIRAPSSKTSPSRTATTVSVDAATHDQRLGDRARPRRQGRAVVRQPDHLRRNDPRQGRREERRRRIRGDVEPRPARLHRQCQCRRAARHGWNAAARSVGHFDQLQRCGRQRTAATSSIGQLTIVTYHRRPNPQH